MLMAIVYAEVPVRSRRIVVGCCWLVSLRAQFKRAEIVVDDVLDVGTSGCAGHRVRIRIRQLVLQRSLDRIGNGQSGPSTTEDALRAGADEVGRLVPAERQIVPPELRRVQRVALVIDSDAPPPEVVGIAAVGGAGLQIDPIEERAGQYLAVFLELGTALRRYRREPVGRRRRLAEPAPWPVAEEAIARLQTAVEIPLRPFRHRRSRHRLLRREGPGKWNRRNQDSAKQQN